MGESSFDGHPGERHYHPSRPLARSRASRPDSSRAIGEGESSPLEIWELPVGLLSGVQHPVKHLLSVAFIRVEGVEDFLDGDVINAINSR